MVGASFDPLWANNETFFEFKATVMKFDLKIKIEIPPSNYDRHCWRGGPKVFPTFVMVVMAFKPSVELRKCIDEEEDGKGEIHETQFHLYYAMPKM